MQIFCALALGERAAEDGEVLREDVDQAAVDAAVAGDEAVAGDDLLVHAEIAAAVGDQLVEFLEGAFVEQQLDALAGGELAFLVLARAALRPAALLGGRVAAAQFVEAVHRHYCNELEASVRQQIVSAARARGWCCRRSPPSTPASSAMS